MSPRWLGELAVRVDRRGLALGLSFFFFNDTATTEIYTLSLHDALPIFSTRTASPASATSPPGNTMSVKYSLPSISDRKSTRLNSSHGYISYAVFCLKKKRTSRRSPPHAPLEPACSTYGRPDPRRSVGPR